MTTLTRWVPPAEVGRHSALVKRIDNIAQVYAGAELALNSVGTLYQDAALDTNYVLCHVEAWVRVATVLQPLTPHQQAALERRTQQFLEDMLTATQDAGSGMRDVLAATRKET